ncbi:MAG: ribonuclease J [Limnochordaceae bacterium]|nr:ribonuclease J [Limnochordaceae bacterium]
MWVLEYGSDIIVIDAGVEFPTEGMLGIDLVIPDMSYLQDRQDRIRALLVSHGHEDHIGAIPYFLERFPHVPVYGTRLTLGLITNKLVERHLDGQADLRVIKARDRVQLGQFEVEFIHVNHSIPDVVAMAVHTPEGTVVYATDFKFDQTPIDGIPTDYASLARLGEEGVLLLMSDSTNAERAGYTLSERVVGQTLDDVFRDAPGRLIVATFASNVHRIQQVIDAAQRYGRRVAFTGRSMVNVVRLAREMGYLRVPEGVLMELDDIERLAAAQTVIVTTGSQGEPTAGLTRMAMADHRRVGIIPGDTVIISATPIPGNERSIGNTINHLFRLGAKVIYHAVSGVHVSGHASQEELKLMLNLVRPRYFVPIHGEYRMLVQHSELAKMVGIPEDHIIIPDLGDRILVGEDTFTRGEQVPAGQVLVDGLGVGDVGTVVLHDRKQLSEDGVLIVVVTMDKQTRQVVAGPDVISRGFVYVKESEELMEATRQKALEILHQWEEDPMTDWGPVKNDVKDGLSAFIWERTKRRPMIMPVIMEV